MRQEHLVKLDIYIAAFGDLKRTANGLRTVFKELIHFLRRLVVKLLFIKSEPVGFGQRRTRPDAKQRIMSGRIFLIQIVAIVGRHRSEERRGGEEWRSR